MVRKNWATNPTLISPPQQTYTFPTWGDIVPNYKKGNVVAVTWSDPPTPNPA